MNWTLKIYFFVFIVVSLVLTVLGFLTSLVCHSSVISLTALFHFSQFVFYSTKLYLINRHKQTKSDGEEKKPTRFGILVDLISSTFIIALCCSIIIKSIEYFFGHQSIHEDDADELHHDHENFTQYQKILLMTILGGLLFVCNLAFLLLTLKETILRKKKHRDYNRREAFPLGSDPPVTCAANQISFKPFANSQIRKENCYLIVPSDLVKMSRRVFFTLTLMSGPIAVLINSAVYMIQYRDEMTASNLTTAVNQDNGHGHHHHEDHENSLVQKCLNFVIINIDPILSILLSVIYLFFFIKIFRLAALILAQFVPQFLDIADVQNEIKQLIPSIKKFHEFYLFEWTPFNLCVSLHFEMEKRENASKSDEQREITEAIKKIKDYFTSTYMIHALAIQPEISNVCASTSSSIS